MEPIFGFALFLLLSIAAASFAKSRGRSWWLYLVGCVVLGFGVTMLLLAAKTSGGVAAAGGMFVPILGFIHTLVMGNPNVKQCPHCAERIKAEATRCKHCGADLGATAAS